MGATARRLDVLFGGPPPISCSVVHPHRRGSPAGIRRTPAPKTVAAPGRRPERRSDREPKHEPVLHRSIMPGSPLPPRSPPPERVQRASPNPASARSQVQVKNAPGPLNQAVNGTIRSSTRRFICRPWGVALVAMGCVSPWPCQYSRSGMIPWALKNSTTARARCSDRSWL